jgi:hypothetical protein
MKKAIIFSLAAILSAPAFAAPGQWTNVTVLQAQGCMQGYGGVCASPVNLVEFQLSANSTGGPACATNKGWVAVDVTTTIGAFNAAMLQSAKLGGSLVNITGLGTCISGNTIENIAIVVEQ